MRSPLTKMFIVLIAVLAVGALFATDAAAQVSAMGGKSKITFTKREIIPVGDADGHILVLSEAGGTNENTGKWNFMAGAKTFSRSTADMVRGNGTQSGYFIISKDGDLAVSKYTGTIRTVLSPEGKPQTSYAGEWKWVKCAGVFEGCTGQGVYQGTTLSENDVLVQYQGIIVQ